MTAPPSPRPTPTPVARAGWALFAVAALAIPAVAMLLERRAPEPPPVFGALPDFALTDQTGAALTRDDLLGKTVVVDFIFTRCPDICPTLSAQMAAVGDSLGPAPFEGPPLHRLSVSVDPTYDQPAVLAEYARGYGADPATWSFVTGEQAEIEALVDGLAQMVERRGLTEDGAPRIAHSQRLLLVDPAGGLRAFHPIDEAGLAALVTDVEAIAREPR